MGGGISLTLFNEIQLFRWVNCKEGNRFQPSTATIIKNSLIRLNVIEFGRVSRGPMTIVNPTGRDIIMMGYGQTSVTTGSDGSHSTDTYYNSFSSTGTWIIQNYFYLKPGQTITAQRNSTSMYPIACYLSAK